MNILEVQHLTKHYKQLTAVNDISFTVKQGICFGLLGPNGAGKTTTLEMIEGLTTPSAGTILYKGTPRSSDFSQQVGIQFQQTALMDFLTVQETLQLFASLYQHPVDLAELAQTCQLQEFLHHDATKLSGGQRQRLLLALALVNNPDLVFLDEPTTGLDPQSRRHFWQLVESIKAKGKTIILTTHYMDEAQKLCDELLIIDKGQIIDQGSPEALLSKHFSFKRLLLAQQDAQFDKQQCPFSLEKHGDDWVILSEQIEPTLAWLMAQGVSLQSLRIEQPNLEDLFIKLTGHRLR
jgi:ABC-2 type transport system ATP-binding protein